MTEQPPSKTIGMEITMIGRQNYNGVTPMGEVYRTSINIRGKSSYSEIFSHAMNAIGPKVKLNPELITEIKFSFKHPPPAQIITIPNED